MKQPKFKPYCIMCSNAATDETCSDNCKDKLQKIRNAIASRILTERSGVKKYDQKTIREFNKIQEIIS